MSDPTPQQPAPSDPRWAPTQLIRPGAEGNGLPVGTRLAEFELLRVLGEGGFGIVYLAQDHMLQRRVAIKEYMPTSLARRGEGGLVVVGDDRQRAVFIAGLTGFVNEARLLAQFDHPSLVKVHRFWQANGTAYMVMPYYEGITLKQTLKDLGGPPDEAWLKTLLRELTGALAVIHAEHCVHRDIAPDNILMLANTGKPLLLDFGAARQVIGDATQALTAILKPGYAPLEQYADPTDAHLKQGPWTDVYALCAVMHTAITGHKPPPAVGRKVHDDYRSLVDVAGQRYSQGLLQGIDAGLRLLPGQRPQSMAALRLAMGLDGPAAAASIQASASATDDALVDLPLELDRPMPSPAPSAQAVAHAAAGRVAAQAGAPASARAPVNAPSSGDAVKGPRKPSRSRGSSQESRQAHRPTGGPALLWPAIAVAVLAAVAALVLLVRR